MFTNLTVEKELRDEWKITCSVGLLFFLMFIYFFILFLFLKFWFVSWLIAPGQPISAGCLCGSLTPLRALQKWADEPSKDRGQTQKDTFCRALVFISSWQTYIFWMHAVLITTNVAPSTVLVVLLIPRVLWRGRSRPQVRFMVFKCWFRFFFPLESEGGWI